MSNDATDSLSRVFKGISANTGNNDVLTQGESVDWWFEEVKAFWTKSDRQSTSEQVNVLGSTASNADKAEENVWEAFDFDDQFKTFQCNAPSSTTTPQAPESAGCDPVEQQWIMHHKNDLLLVGLQRNHPAVLRVVDMLRRNGHPPRVSVQYHPTLLNKQISGKRKKGAVQAELNTTLCTIKLYPSAPADREENFSSANATHPTPDGAVHNGSDALDNQPTKLPPSGADAYPIKGAVYGNIIEYNDALESYLQNLTAIPTLHGQRNLWCFLIQPHSKRQLQKSLAFHRPCSPGSLPSHAETELTPNGACATS